jgi:hypothetical protein
MRVRGARGAGISPRPRTLHDDFEAGLRLNNERLKAVSRMQGVFSAASRCTISAERFRKEGAAAVR